MTFSFLVSGFWLQVVGVRKPDPLPGTPWCFDPVAPPTQDYCERYRQLTGQDLLQCPHCNKGQMRRIGVLSASAAIGGWDSL
jgi:hypothetical protein